MTDKYGHLGTSRPVGPCERASMVAHLPGTGSATPESGLRPEVVVSLWNLIAQAGGTLQETLIRFARLIEAEVRR